MTNSTSLLIVLLTTIASIALGHSYLSEPPSRNLVAVDSGEKCPHCLQAGGPNNVKSRGGNVWPTRLAPSSHGLCGDPVQNRPNPVSLREEEYLKPTEPQRAYMAGQEVTFKITISTHHMGHYEFRLCNRSLDGSTLESAQEGQDCLDQVLLQRAPPASTCSPNDPDPDCQPLDADYPHRWYLPPTSYGMEHVMRYRIPAGLSCRHCTLQWYWATGNTCLYDEGYFDYFRNMKALGWNAELWSPFATSSWASKKSACCGPAGNGNFGEEFWNCADITVLSTDGEPPSSSLQPPPSVTLTTSLAPPFSTQPVGPCSAVWAQCGGQEWSGPFCCEPASSCQFQNPWYSQCLPGSAPVPTSPAPTSLPTIGPTLVPPTPSPGSTPVGRHGFITSSGTMLIDAHGQPVHLRGMSMFWSQWEEGSRFYTRDAVSWLIEDWRISLVRVAVGVEPDGYLANPEAQKVRVKTVINAAIEFGIYVIVDWHDHNAELHVQEAKAFFEEIAREFGQYPNVLFEPFNEPEWQDWRTVIKPYHEQIIPIIRQHSLNLIILGSRQWSQNVDEAATDPVVGLNLAYSLHFYANTHTGELRNKALDALASGITLFVTEWGACSANGNGDLNLAETQTWLDFLADKRISDANWGVYDKDERCAALRPGSDSLGGWEDSQLTESGRFIRSSLREFYSTTLTTTSVDSGASTSTTTTTSPTSSPEPEPEPEPTLEPETTSGPSCQWEAQMVACTSQGGRYECKRCLDGYSGDHCCTCQGGAPSSTTSTTTSLTIATTSLTSGSCKTWCAGNAKPWQKKCQWDGCAGCPQCIVRRLRGKGFHP